MKIIDYFYVPISGYAYLGEKRLMHIAKAKKASVRFYPIDILKVFEASGTVPPFKQSEARLNYRFSDMQRIAELEGLPINPKPKYWPVPAGLASKLILLVQEMGGDPHSLSFAFLEAVYAKQQDISDLDTVAKILEQFDEIDSKILLQKAQEDSAQDMFDASTQKAIDAKVFGSPTYVFEGELFFGQDRLNLLEYRLEQK